ncbi:MAG TPA: DUF2059 domain-containing protein [Candidatus Angelobacter sp.]|jgi:hypothetical protein|nr:DUF2059 domain-containing protein [Candidatus Angelobacter sp.]
MKKVCLALAAGFILCLPGIAQQNPADAPAAQADVERYLQVVHSKEMLAQVADNMSKPIQKMIHEECLKHQDTLSPDFEARMNNLMNDMLKNMPWGEMFKAMMPVYQKHFTKGDLDAMIAFYSTPTGQKVLRETPGLTIDTTAAIMPVVNQYLGKINARMQGELEAVLKEAKKSSAVRKN